MSDSKNSMIFFYDWQNLFEELTDAEVGQLVKAALKYDQTGDDTKFQDKGMRVAFKAMKNSIKVSNEKYQTACDKKREAMERRWKKNRDVYTSIDIYKQSSDTDTVTHTVTETETVTDTGSDSGSNNTVASPQPALTQRELDRIMDAWNNQKCTLDIKGFTKKRIKEISFLVNGNLEKFLDVIKSLNKQQYLIDQADKNMPTHFDWFLDPENYQSVIEGKYEKKYGTGGGYGLARDW